MGDRPDGNTPPVDPALLARPDVCDALAGHDIGALFRALGQSGWTQREIAKATTMPQSSVSEIVTGRRVIDYRVLVRIADGLGIPRELMNFTSGDGGAYPGGTDPTEEISEEVRAAMRRRALLAAAGIAVVGRPLQDISDLTPLPGPAPVPLPSRILGVHVVKVRDLTRRLAEAGCAYGSDPQVSSAAAAWATRLLDVSGAEPVKRALRSAVAELHIHAGWSAFDASLPELTMHHYTRGLELATDTGDTYLQTIACNQSGLATVEYGHPDDGLKLLQLGQLNARKILTDDGRTMVVGGNCSPAAAEACARADSATALFRLGYPDAADTEVATSRELWIPTASDPSGDLDRVAASLALDRGRLDIAEPFAAASLQRWEGGSRRARTGSLILLATIHVRAGEPDGVRLAHDAITGVTKLSSMRARRRLEPLVAALHARPGSDTRELARTAHHIATTRA